MDEVVQTALSLVNDGKWLALTALVLGFVMRSFKPDVLWMKIDVAPRYRPLVLAGLGVVASACNMIATGTDWQAALKWGMSAALMAMLGHVFGIEMLRGGKELPMPGVSTTKVGVSLFVLMPALLAFGPSSCTKNAGTPISWPEVVQCIGDPLELVGDVGDILINDYGGNELSTVGRQKLEDLATKKGTPAVLCLVDRLVREWVAPAAAPDPTRLAGAKRGESFLRAIGTKVQRL